MNIIERGREDEVSMKWKLEKTGTSNYTMSDDEGRIIGGISLDPNQQEEIARLIDAAPELLEACERIKRAIAAASEPERVIPARDYEFLRAAIDKALTNPESQPDPSTLGVII